MAAVLRMHVCVPDEARPESSHAWLSLEKDGATTTYGLQGRNSIHAPEGQGRPRTSDGKETDLHRNCDGDWADRGKVLRELPLNDAQVAGFEKWADTPQKYGDFRNNCAHAARDGWKAGTGEHFDVTHQIPERIDPTETFPFDCPAGLAASVAKGPAAQAAPEAPPSQAPPAGTPPAPAASRVAADFSRPLPPPPPPPPPETSEKKEFTR